ncbi:hypothetical protein NL676_004992 [Syzygium grande]|nr:hypothetical protein NL676_004992 [Syzygium grande]
MSLTLLRKIHLLQLLGSSVTGKSDASDHGRLDPGRQGVTGHGRARFLSDTDDHGWTKGHGRPDPESQQRH